MWFCLLSDKQHLAGRVQQLGAACLTMNNRIVQTTEDLSYLKLHSTNPSSHGELMEMHAHLCVLQP